ncbi:hypothetical protein JTT01_01345 [Clostridium botulinum]|nr:hypothetical protein [Clostridium botulinum]
MQSLVPYIYRYLFKIFKLKISIII